MEIVKYSHKEHYNLICSWFDAYAWERFPADCIPEDTMYIVTRNNELIAVSGYFDTNSAMALLSFTIANPKSRDRGDCLDFLLKHIFSEVSKKYRFLHYATGPESKHVVERLQRLGMEITDSGNAYILTKAMDGSSILFMDE